MKKLVYWLYDYEYTGNVKNEDSSNEEEVVIAVQQSRLVSCINSSEEQDKIKRPKEGGHDKLNVDSNEPIKIFIN